MASLVMKECHLTEIYCMKYSENAQDVCGQCGIGRREMEKRWRRPDDREAQIRRRGGEEVTTVRHESRRGGKEVTTVRYTSAEGHMIVQYVLHATCSV